MENLLDELFNEMNRVRELIKEYRDLPGGVGNIGAALMQININNAEKAIREGDIIKELEAYGELKNCEYPDGKKRRRERRKRTRKSNSK
jgi:hypothetical protein